MGSTVEIPSVIPTCPVGHVTKSRAIKRYRLKFTPQREDSEDDFDEVMFPEGFLYLKCLMLKALPIKILR